MLSIEGIGRGTWASGAMSFRCEANQARQLWSGAFSNSAPESRAGLQSSAYWLTTPATQLVLCFFLLAFSFCTDSLSCLNGEFACGRTFGSFSFFHSFIFISSFPFSATYLNAGALLRIPTKEQSHHHTFRYNTIQSVHACVQRRTLCVCVAMSCDDCQTFSHKL